MGKDNKIKEAKVVENKNNKKEVALTIIKKIWDIVFWILVICLAAIWISDFILVKQDKDPKFCIKTQTIETENGNIESCTGIGYKVFKYHTKGNEGAREFGPFWQEPRK